MPPSDTRSISIVFVSYNSAETIGAAIDSVRRYLPDAEIVVVDNGSADETCRIVREHAPAQLIEGHGNIGFGAGVNLGARGATGNLLIVLNPDAAIVHANVERLTDLATQSPTGMLGCLLRDRRNTRYLKYSEWGWRRELSWLLMQWFLAPREINVRRLSAHGGSSRLWISGAAFVVNRSEFLNIGGFDEELFLYLEDVDLSRRYREQGAGVGTTDAVVVTHTGQGSSPGGHEQIQSWALLSLLEMVAKWNRHQDGERAARTTLRLLNSIATIARLAGALPFLGRRAAAKAQSADAVRDTLLGYVNSTPTSGVYPRARAALAAVATPPRTV